MTKRILSKFKLDRRLGINLWGRAKSPINKKNYGPGQHGQGRKKISDYGIQLRAKQKLKGYYGNIGERQFKNICTEAARLKGDTSENIINLLEHRLDAFVYRLKWAPTVFAARQFVNHCHVLVNGKKVNIPSYRLKDGDEVALKDTMKDNAIVISSMASSERKIPDYIETDIKGLKGKILRGPKIEEVPYPVQMEPNLIIEFYSR